jgi:hypothetical protein
VVFWPRTSGKKWGRSSPIRSRSAAILSILSSVTFDPLGTCSIAKVNARVTDTVICVFHAPVTFRGRKCAWNSLPWTPLYY